MGNNTATEILAEASKHVGGNRDIHGDVDGSYTMVAQMWEVYLRHSNQQRHESPSSINLRIDSVDVLEMLSIMKKCRGVYSTSPNRENYVDDAGYVSLAGMIATRPKLDEIEDNIRKLASTVRPRVGEG